MRQVILLTALLLTGCATTKLVPEEVFPTPPAELMTPSETMTKLPDGPVKATDALAIVNDNYAAANANKVKLDALQQWITETEANVQKANGKNKNATGKHQ